MLQSPHRIPQHAIRERIIARRARRAITARQTILVRIICHGKRTVAVRGDVVGELLLDSREHDFDFHGGQGVGGVEEGGDEGRGLGDEVVDALEDGAGGVVLGEWGEG